MWLPSLCCLREEIHVVNMAICRHRNWSFCQTSVTFLIRAKIPLLYYILSAGAWQGQELMPSTAEPFLGTSVCSDSASEPLRAVCIPGKIQRVSVFPLSECFGTTRTNKEFHFLTSHGAQGRSFCSKRQIWRESGALFNQSFVRVWILGRTTGRPVC